jgi:DNA-3-methyladenine glycosylase II
MRTLSFTLTPVPSFRLDLTVWALRRRKENLLDRWDGETYRRVLAVAGTVAEVAVRQEGGPDAPLLRVDVRGERLPAKVAGEVEAALTRLLGLTVDLADFYALADRDHLLAPLAGRFRGVKPPRFPTLFETVANAVACQQITLTFGIQVLVRLAEAFGPPLTAEPGAPRAFPGPQDLAGRRPEELGPLGFSRQKAQALLGVARAVAEGALDLDRAALLPDGEARDFFLALHGLGRWSAEYVLLRGLGRLRIFPADDVGARNSLLRWLGLTGPLDYAGVQELLAGWQPYAGLVYIHLLLRGLAETGQLSPSPE